MSKSAEEHVTWSVRGSTSPVSGVIRHGEVFGVLHSRLEMVSYSLKRCSSNKLTLGVISTTLYCGAVRIASQMCGRVWLTPTELCYDISSAYPLELDLGNVQPTNNSVR